MLLVSWPVWLGYAGSDRGREGHTIINHIHHTLATPTILTLESLGSLQLSSDSASSLLEPVAIENPRDAAHAIRAPNLRGREGLVAMVIGERRCSPVL